MSPSQIEHSVCPVTEAIPTHIATRILAEPISIQQMPEDLTALSKRLAADNYEGQSFEFSEANRETRCQEQRGDDLGISR